MMIDEITSGAAQLLDVRTNEEWESGHAAGAIHIPVTDLLSGTVDALTPGKKVYVYCLSGGRAARSVEYLRHKGYDAENVGGLADWLRAGGALDKN